MVLAPAITLLGLALGWWWALACQFGSHLLLALNTLLPCSQGFGPVYTHFVPQGDQVWITLDDGPDPETTPEILKVLDRHAVRVTFFLIGAKVRRHPKLAHRILLAGHQIGNHTATHPHLKFWRLGPMALRKEVAGFESACAAVGLPCPALVRAPAGMKNPFLHPCLSARGLVLVGWSARAYDTRHRNAALTVRRLSRKIRPGAILLLHDGVKDTAVALDSLLVQLRTQGYRPVVPALPQLRTKPPRSLEYF
ncbi:MAG: polysaccharide deacetylase family protein [Verrucomicrobia bacterium]|nr:polysaccharide deacetylase family protein [Verrucomicrobiota bacterium]